MISRRTRTVIATLCILTSLAAALHPALADAGAERVERMFQRAIATFAVTRALNGVISVVQGTEVALQPAGVGVTLTLGQALDPLNDLIERFSWLMLAASTALGTQAVLIEASGAGGLAVLLGMLAAATLLRLWWPPLAEFDRNGLLPRALALALFLRLALPLSALAAESFSSAWLAPKRAAAMTTLEATRNELDAMERSAPEPAGDEAGILDAMRRYVEAQGARLDLDRRLEALTERIDSAAERIIDLTIIFILETVLVPLGALWLMWQLLLRTVQSSLAAPPGSTQRSPDP